MEPTVNRARRRFLLAGLAGPECDRLPFRPPWTTEEAVLRSCTGCGACVEACAARLITLADGKPQVTFDTAECTFCGACAEACAEPVFDRSRRPFRHVATLGDGCLAHGGVVCQSCRDACPEAAIRFVPRRGGPFLPDIQTPACTGCGACVTACPTSAMGLVHQPEIENA